MGLKGRSKMSRSDLMKVLLENNDGYMFEISCFDLVKLCEKWSIKRSTLSKEILQLSYILLKDKFLKNRENNFPKE